MHRHPSIQHPAERQVGRLARVVCHASATANRCGAAFHKVHRIFPCTLLLSQPCIVGEANIPNSDATGTFLLYLFCYMTHWKSLHTLVHTYVVLRSRTNGRAEVQARYVAGRSAARFEAAGSPVLACSVAADAVGAAYLAGCPACARARPPLCHSNPLPPEEGACVRGTW